MDDFTEKKFDQFAHELGKNLEGLDTNERNSVFEQFAAFYVLRRWHVRDLKAGTLPAITIGGVYDQQLDGVAILVNGRVITREDQIEPAFAAEDDPTLRFIFLQSTTSNKFDRAKMNTFSIGVANFWHNNDYDPANEDLIQARDLKDKVYEAFREESGGRLHFHLYYICLGNWRTESDFDDSALVDEPEPGDSVVLSSSPGARKKRGWRGWTEDYISSHLPNWPVCAEIVDAKRLREWIDWVVAKDELTTIVRPVDYVRTIKAPQVVSFPTPGLDAKGFIGFITARELIILLEREDGQGLMEPVFHENVRGFKESSQVNQGMAETLNSPERAQFMLRNNGITIVCEHASKSTDGIELSLTNYQIVNGLQTSHVIYQNRAHLLLEEDVLVPLKIVVTEDLELKDAIIESTNRQTTIKPVEYLGRRPIVRRLEDYFAMMRQRKDVPPLWLERRQGQYLQNEDIASPDLVIGLQDLLLSYASVFLEEPHDAERGINKIIAKVPRRILREDDDLEVYFYAAWIHYVVKDWLRRKKISDLSTIQFHLHFALRILAEDFSYQAADTDRKRDTYFEALAKTLSSQRKVDPLLARCARFLRNIMEGAPKRTNVAVLARTRNDVRKRALSSKRSQRG